LGLGLRVEGLGSMISVERFRVSSVGKREPYNRVTPPVLQGVIDSGLVGSTDFHWEGYHESRRCFRDTYPESYIARYTNIRRESHGLQLRFRSAETRVATYGVQTGLHSLRQSSSCQGSKWANF